MSTSTLPGVTTVVGRDADAPPLAGNTARGRFYRLTPGGPLAYPSITTVKEVKASEGLSKWKIKMAALKAFSWLEWAARVSADDPDRAAQALAQVTGRGARRWKSQVRAAAEVYATERAERGSMVHLAIEQILTGREVNSEAEAGPVAAFKAFMADLQIVPVEVEVTVVNHTHRYAGTGDLLARVGGPDGPLAVVDWKTRDSIYADTSLQLAAIANAEFILRPDGSQEPMPSIEVGIGVALGSDGRYRAHPMDIGEETFAAFCAARTLFDFDPALAPAVHSPAELPTR